MEYGTAIFCEVVLKKVRKNLKLSRTNKQLLNASDRSTEIRFTRIISMCTTFPQYDAFENCCASIST